MFKLAFFFVLIVFSNSAAMTNSPEIEPGVSKELAAWRTANYSDVSYKLDLIIRKMAPTLKGTIEISLTTKSDTIILDWRKIKGSENLSKISNISINGVSLGLKPESKDETRQQLPVYREQSEHLVLSDGVIIGKNSIKIDFDSPILKSGSAVTRYVDSEDGSEYIYSLFVPSDASTAFPVFDQPDLKARFTLKISLDRYLWGAIANAPVKEARILVAPSPPGNFSEKIVRTIEFEETKPISTYVFAFAVGPFQMVEVEGLDPVTYVPQEDDLKGESPADNERRVTVSPNLRVYLRKSQFEKFKPHAKEVIRLNREAIKYFEKYFDYKFPFPKYDLVLIPEFPFGGMEHAGATFLRERSIIFPTEPTANNYISRASLIFHEAAHQWFGDTVTMKWFDDLWLKEGFATFMAYKAMGDVMPEYNSWKVFYERTKPGAYATDVTKGTVPIYQDIPNLNAAKSAYGNIVYQKAPSFLKQAEFYFGEETFQQSVRAFLKQHEYGNATWSDLVSAFESTSSKDLSSWSDAWVKTRGVPIVRVKVDPYHEYQDLGKPHDTANIYSLTQEDAVGEGGEWPVKTKVLLRFENGSQEIKEVDLATQNPKAGFAKYWVDIQSKPDFKSQSPIFVFPNFDDKAYGVFLLDPRSQRYAIENIRSENDSFLRSMMWGALWDSVRFGELDPVEYLDLTLENIEAETDETTISSILGRARTAYTYYINDSSQARYGPKLEELLRRNIESSKKTGEILTYYRAFLSIAESGKAKEYLKTLFREAALKEKNASTVTFAPSLLKTKDRFDIVERLIVLRDKDAPRMLAELEKTETDDASKRDAYAAKAGFATAANKQKYFDDFINNKEISESWVEAAFDVWNAPSHEKLTLPYLKKALAELLNLKRDRKIFFVNGWLGAFIGGQRSKEALGIVNKFLKDNPNLDADLKRKILENADGLERAVNIRNKYS